MIAQPEVVVIGAAIVDIPLSPVDRSVFDAPSHPLERIRMQVGGDAANEAAIIARLGHAAALAGVVGDDAAGTFVRGTLAREGVDTRWLRAEAGLDTGINVVLVHPDGERSFITSRTGSLRRLSLRSLRPALEDPAFAKARVCCLASLFVSPELSVGDTAALFEQAHAMGLLTCADTTRPKHGETAWDLREVFSRLDYFFPNLSEAALLTGQDAPDAIADALLDCGLKHLALKLGGEGCLIADARGRRRVPAVPGVVPVDTTGAGDTFAGAFIAGLLEGRSFADCARFANAAASLCVETVGATAGAWTRADVARRLGN